MRTTIDLDERLLQGAKRIAAEQGETVSAVLNDALAAYLAGRRAASQDEPFEVLVRGSSNARFPTLAEIAATEDEDALAALAIARTGQRASP